MSEPNEKPPVTLTVDGKEVTVPAGTLIIRAAEQLGVEIPRFCDHPLLEPVGACRQCYVEVEGQRKLLTSCTTPVGEGMVVRTQNTSEQARIAQVGNLEFLLLNHPLDCPICDRGGECPLQDQALEFGPGESRFIEAKRTYEKPIELSPLVSLDRERCVLCARCTRFADEIAGDRQIELFSRGAWQQVAIAPGETFDSPFSGNTIQICPVGALTAETYRFSARPFDLKHVDSVCGHCSAGCNVRVDARRNRVVRVLARDNDEVNEAWMCDKGRFAFRFADAENRLVTPLLRDHGLEPVSFGEAFEWIGRELGGKDVAFLTGGRLRDEDYYAMSKLARTVFQTNDIDHRTHLEGGAPELLAAAGAADVTYADIESAPVIVIAGLDTEQEVPILHLRVRKAARKGARVFVVSSRRTRLWDVAEHIVCLPGGEAAAMAEHAGLNSALEQVREGTLVIAGERLASYEGVADSVWNYATDRHARLAWVSRRANDRGALRAGAHPWLLPGGRSVGLDDERAEVEAAWGTSLPGDPGRDAHAILEAAAAREIDGLFLIGVDPLRDFPDAALARRGLENVAFLVVQDIARGGLDLFADVMLPAASSFETSGHVTTWEGRRQHIRPVRDPIGSTRADWEIFTGLAEAMGTSLGFASLDELQEELDALVQPRTSLNLVTEVAGMPGAAASDGHVTLFTHHLLVDQGTLSGDAPELKAAQEKAAFVEIEPADAAAAGIEDGAMAVVRTDAGEATLPARVSKHIRVGTIFVPFNNDGLAANTLLSGRFVTPATIEPAVPAEMGANAGTDEGAKA